MELILQLYIFILGIVFGSFFNVCIYRIPEKKSISNPPSTCPTCNTRLKPIDLIPVLSYLSSKRKCRYCKEPISPRYMCVELITGMLFLLVYNRYPMSIQSIYYLTLASLLIIITFIDIDHYIIPDGLIITGLIFAFILNLLGIGIPLREGLVGALISGGGMLVLIYTIEFIVKKEVMGGGDIKLFAMVGFFLGIKGGLLTILLSVYVGAIYGVVSIIYIKIKNKEYNSMIPYGPFISVGAIIVLLYGNDILNWYQSLFI